MVNETLEKHKQQVRRWLTASENNGLETLQKDGTPVSSLGCQAPAGRGQTMKVRC